MWKTAIPVGRQHTSMPVSACCSTPHHMDHSSSLTVLVLFCWRRCCSEWNWNFRQGRKMINKVASTFQVDRRVRCMTNCSVSPICDSYNYRSADKTCQINTHDTPQLHSKPTRPTLSPTAPGAGTAPSSLKWSSLMRERPCFSQSHTVLRVVV